MKNSGQEFEWSFPGGIPSSSTVENPLVYYANPGNYDVTLTVNDANGSDTQTISNLITYEDLSLSDLNEMQESFEAPDFPPSGWTLPSLDIPGKELKSLPVQTAK